jgi:hypothetical protein
VRENALAYFVPTLERTFFNIFQVNFFIHNLAMRFGDTADDDSGVDSSDVSSERRKKSTGELLSFIPKTYSLKSDGRIEAVVVFGIQVTNMKCQTRQEKFVKDKHPSLFSFFINDVEKYLTTAVNVIILPLLYGKVLHSGRLRT